MTAPGPPDAPMATGVDLQPYLLEVQQVSQNVQQLQTLLQGNPSQGVISYSMVTEHVKDVAPQVVALTQGLQTLQQQVTNVAEPLAEPIFLPLESFVVNLKDGRRFLKTTIQLMLSEPGAAAYLTVRLVEVKDLVLGELQELSVEDVKQSDARDALKQRLISAISQVFPSTTEWEDPEPIKKVLFEEFVIQ